VKPLSEEVCIYGDLLTLLGTRTNKDFINKLDSLDQVISRTTNKCSTIAVSHFEL
jgi:hypothetical protein